MGLMAFFLLASHGMAQPVALPNTFSETADNNEFPTENFNFHWQTTYINHRNNNFRSSYASSNSLLNRTEGGGTQSYSFSGTAFLGARVGESTEFYFNPETFQGIPFGGQLVGLGGFQNGELQKGSFSSPVFYNARAFFRHTIGLSGDREYVNGEANQLAGYLPKNRLVLTIGKVSTLDFFDDNAYSHDPRSQFQNFSLFSMGAYGYASDTKGFTYGAISELYWNQWILKAARLALPAIPNTSDLDLTLKRHYGNQLELTRLYEVNGKEGAVRGLVYSQHAYMANFESANAMTNNQSPIPDMTLVRKAGTSSWGYGLNFEQAISDNLGVFARWSWNPGATETQTLDMRSSLAGGISLKGKSWSRTNDTLGIGLAANSLATSEIQYLKKGGMTSFLGDGNLDYGKEKIFEVYYSAEIFKNTFMTFDLQKIQNPGFNLKRGPINMMGLRLHLEI